VQRFPILAASFQPRSERGWKDRRQASERRLKRGWLVKGLHRDAVVISSPAERALVLERVRDLCLSFPQTTERLSHGSPTFFVRGKRAFTMVLTDHHGDGRFALWCAAPQALRRMLVDGNPERFFVPPYVGHRGWVGVRLDRGLEWGEVAGVLEEAYAAVAPASLVRRAAAGSP
jgi:hypothetical protein